MKKRDLNNINYILLIITVLLLVASVYFLYKSGITIKHNPFYIKYNSPSSAYIGYRILNISMITGFITLITRMYINFLKDENNEEVESIEEIPKKGILMK